MKKIPCVVGHGGVMAVRKVVDEFVCVVVGCIGVSRTMFTVVDNCCDANLLNNKPI